MSEKPGLSYLWIAVSLSWMAVVYAFSAQAHSGDITKIYLHDANVPIRKLGHFCEFGLLAIFYAKALLVSFPERIRLCLIVAFAMATVWAGLDEFHQSFVPGRSAAVTDVLVDASGALLFVLVFALLLRRRGV